MSYEIETGVPAVIRAGTTVEFKVPEDQRYPVTESWVYTFYLVGYLGASTVGVGALGAYTFTLAATTTDDILVGPYQWEIRASLAGVVKTAYAGRLEVTPNLAVLTATDARSWTEKMVAVVESLLYGNGTFPEVESYQIHGRQLVKMERAELFKLLQQLKGELASQQGGGKRASARIYFGASR